MDKQNGIYPMVEYYSAIERNEVLVHATTWMNLENMLNKINQAQVCILYDFIHMKYLELVNPCRQVARGWGKKGMRSVCLMGMEFPFGVVKVVDGGNGCIHCEC